MTSSSFPLPSEIIFEILSRTSLRTLDTCKAVNKEWRDLIFESNFMLQFCRKNQNILGYFVQTLSKTKHVTKFVSMNGCSGNSSIAPFHLPIDDIVKRSLDHFANYHFDIMIEASKKQGILCCVRSSRREYRYHICKPSTKQWFKLPNPRIRFPTAKVALIVLRSNPLYFKIIRLSYIGIPNIKIGLKYYRCEIFDSQGWEWRQGKDLLVPRGTFFDMFTQAVNANGLIYFKLTDDQVITLNYNGEEVFPRFSLPPNPVFDKYKYNKLVEYKGKLGFNCLSPKGIELWVFDNRNQVWELKKEVDIGSIKRVTEFPRPVGFYNADIVVLQDYDKVIFYNLQDKSFNVVILDKCSTIKEIFPFQSDLEPINLRILPETNIVSSTKHLNRLF